jgi:Major Facilitator Superfamily
MRATLQFDFQTQEDRVTDGAAAGLDGSAHEIMAATSPPRPQAGRRRPPQPRQARYGAVFAVVTAGIAVVNLDLFIVNVALPSIGRDFHGTDLASLSWVLNAYAIVFAALLVPAGRAADLIGRRAAFLTGMIVFAVASAACAAAPDGRDPRLDVGRRRRRRARPGHRRRAGGGELALGVPGERPDHRYRADRRCPGHPA